MQTVTNQFVSTLVGNTYTIADHKLTTSAKPHPRCLLRV